jgi:hypothetical protein
MSQTNTSKTQKMDRAGAAVDRPFDSDSLVGSFFLSFEPQQDSSERRRVCWQGVVVAEPHPGVYLVETFDWVVGSAYTQQLVRIGEMVDGGWQFFDSAEWMTGHYQDHYSRHRGRG